MDSERLEKRVSDYLNGLARLERAVSRPYNEFVGDSVIRRFKLAHELAWKMLKLRLEQEDIFAKTPRETLQSSLEAGFIEDGNAWSDLQKMRNLASHTYNEELAEEVYSFVVGQGISLFQQLAQKAVSWQTKI